MYITVTGTSAEAGDDGNTGRGNRITGLITPNRQMSMEATAGKNPVSHVGKIYNVMARLISERIYNEVYGIKEVYVKILSQIGKPITEPQAIHIQYIKTGKSDENIIRTNINRIVEEEFTADRFRQLTKEILIGKYLLF
jgi:S-adenosylmethionine synthetase